MDTILNKIERLAEMAARRPDPVALDAGGVMARIRSLEIEDDSQVIPIGFFAGGAALAAAAAIGVTVLAATAWQGMFSPVAEMNSLMDVMDIML